MSSTASITQIATNNLQKKESRVLLADYLINKK